MTSHKAGISAVFNIAFKREGTKNEEVITTRGIENKLPALFSP